MKTPDLANSLVAQRLTEMVQQTKLIMESFAMAPEKFEEVFLGTGLKMDVNRGSLSSDQHSINSGFRLRFDLKDARGITLLPNAVIDMKLVTPMKGTQRWEVAFNTIPFFAQVLQDRNENNALPEHKQKPIKDGPWMFHPALENGPEITALSELVVASAFEQTKAAASHCLKSDMLEAVKTNRAEMFSKPPEIDPAVDKAMKISANVDSFLNSLTLNAKKGPRP